MKRWSILIAATFLAGCAVGPNYRRPASLPPGQARLIEAIGNGSITPTPLPPQWWHLFDDPELDRLVTLALTNNIDLRIAAANLQRARALLSEAGAARLPTSDASAQYTKRRTAASGQTNGGGTATKSSTLDYFALGFDASYEVDLFGGVSRSIEAARSDYSAAQAAVDGARVAVAAETARTYIEACSNAAQADAARETEALQARTLDLTERRLSAGRGTRAEVDQAQVLVEQARAQIPAFEAERRAALYALAFKDVNSSRTSGVRAQLRTKPGPLDVTVKVIRQETKLNGTQNVDVDQSLGGTPNPDIPGGVVLSERQQFRRGAEPYRDGITILNADATLHLGAVDLFSSTSFLSRQQNADIDFSNFLPAVFGGPRLTNPGILANATRGKDFVREMRLVSASPASPFQWVIGAFYDKGRKSF